MSKLTRTDVTAVTFYENFVLTGIGNFVNVFEKHSRKLLQRTDVLVGQRIYGFVSSKCSSKILIFGGKQFVIAYIELPMVLGSKILNKISEPVVCNDWLHSAVWINESRLGLLTAHNVVQIWDTTNQTLLSQHHSKDNSILYSGLLLSLQQDILVFAGTVFSEVIIHSCGDDKPLHRLKGHKGVIFSIICDPQKEIIVTTSDDRSVRIWGPNMKINEKYNTKEYWEKIEIICKYELYGHTARVMRSCITKDYVISVGEDSTICFWDSQGKLLRKIVSHQNGCIWAVDSDDYHLVTGGGDCGIMLHPLTIISEYSQNEVLHIDEGTPKKVVFTARGNVIILTENSKLIYHDVIKNSKTIHVLEHESSYVLLSVSSCRQILALVDMCGNIDIFAENCKDEPAIQRIINEKLEIGKVLSVQWAGNRHLVLCSENGLITVLASKGTNVDIYGNFILPRCKERWLTASAIDCSNRILILGDRCGSIHIYVKNQKQPIKTFNKIHGRYGPTSIKIENSEIITTGRDGTIKYFSVINNDGIFKIKYMRAKDLQFQWVEKFLDKNNKMICGFQERVFVVYEITNNSKLLEVNCGGGHRSWDAIRYIDKIENSHEEFIKLIYLKNSELYSSTFQLSKIVSKNIVNGSHSKEINCLKTYKMISNKDTIFYISGGEDTTLRISSVNTELEFKDEIVFKHLSSVRTLKLFVLGENEILLISAGGRAQICVKILKFENINNVTGVISEEIIDYMIKGTDKERKGNQNWRNCSIDFNPETRIMDLDLIRKDNDELIVLTGCSDATLRIFTLDIQLKTFTPIKELKHHQTCILKTRYVNFLNKDILITCSTRGEITLWEFIENSIELRPFFTTFTNKSGINSLTTKALSNNQLLIGTGGDDNSIYLILLEIENDLESTLILQRWSSDKFHSSQITGLILLEDILISTSIDQRITVSRWEVNKGNITCEFVSQMYSNVSDIQGIDVQHISDDSATVSVYGKGLEVIKITKPR